MTSAVSQITLVTPQDTAAFAARLGAMLRRGDCLLLAGKIGSGKTHFARSLIQSLLSEAEDVPSPTFTLVQTYDTPKGEIWHSDLYRLTDVDELEELGLTDAFDTAICLIEWPEKLGPLEPAGALSLLFETDLEHEDTRHLTITWSDPKWRPLLETLE